MMRLPLAQELQVPSQTASDKMCLQSRCPSFATSFAQSSSSYSSQYDSSTSIQRIAMKLNDAACTLSEHSDYDNAVELLREAMLVVSTIADPSSPSLDVFSSIDESYSVDAMTFRAQLLLSSLEARGYTPKKSKKNITSSDDDSDNDDEESQSPTLLPVYHAEMSIQAHLDYVRFHCADEDSQYIDGANLSPSKLSSVLIYNLALINRQSKSVDDASQLYSMAVSAAQIVDNDSASTTQVLSSEPSATEMVYLYALNNLAECRYQLGARSEAVQALTEASAWARHLLHMQPSRKFNQHVACMLVKVQSNLGLLYYQLGEMERSLDMLNEAFCFNKSYEPEGNLATVQTQYNLGLVLQSLSVTALPVSAEVAASYMGRAREMFRLSYDATLRLLSGCTDGDICKRYGHFAPRIFVLIINKCALLDGGEITDQDADMQEVADMHAKMARHKTLEQKLDYSFRHGLDGADLASEINGLGAVYSDGDDHDKALCFYSEGLRLELAVLGKNHPNVLITLNNIGQSLHCKGRYSSALKYYTKALAIRDSFGSQYDHLPVVPTLMHNVALIYSHTGRQNNALPYLQSSLQLQRRLEASGDASYDKDVLASSLYNIGVIHADQGRLDDAVPALMESVAVRQSSPDSDDIDIAEALVKVGRIFQAKGEYENGLSIYQCIFELDLPVSEPDFHEIILQVRCSVAHLHHSLSHHDEALRHYTSALDLLDDVASLTGGELGVRSRARLVSVLGAIAGIHSERGDVAQAERFLVERTRVQRVGYGEDDNLSGYHNLPAPAA